MTDAASRADVQLALDDAIAAAAKLACLLSAARAMHEVGAAPLETLKVLSRAGRTGHELTEHMAIAVGRL